MTDQELFAYKQGRANVLNDATRANTYQMRDAQEPADLLLREAIQHFGKDMYNKALLARDKYDFHPMGWVYPDWQEELQRQMAEHVLKGDPRDTGWLSTIAWYHGWRTAAATPPAPVATGGASEARGEVLDTSYVPTWEQPNMTAPHHVTAAGEISKVLGLSLEQRALAKRLITSVLLKEEERTNYWRKQHEGAALAATAAAKEAAPLGGWVAVEAALPQDHRPVIVWGKAGWYMMAIARVGQDGSDAGHLWEEQGTGKKLWGEITHWREVTITAPAHAAQ